MCNALRDIVDEGGVRFTVTNEQVRSHTFPLLLVRMQTEQIYPIPLRPEHATSPPGSASGLLYVSQSRSASGKNVDDKGQGVNMDLVLLHEMVMKVWYATGR